METRRGRVVIAKDGLYSQFRDVFHCMWYFCDHTTVGYGDIFPATNNGKVLAIVMMLAGSLYVDPTDGHRGNCHLNNNKKLLKRSGEMDLNVALLS